MDGGQRIAEKESVSLILPHNGSLMMVQEANPKYYRRWNHPQGGPREGESLEEAAVREGKEEAGLDIEIVEVFAIFVCEEEGYRETCFRARPITLVPQPLTDEIILARWFPRTSILPELRGKFRSLLTVIRLFHWMRNPERGGVGIVEIPPKGMVLSP